MPCAEAPIAQRMLPYLGHPIGARQPQEFIAAANVMRFCAKRAFRASRLRGVHHVQHYVSFSRLPLTIRSRHTIRDNMWRDKRDQVGSVRQPRAKILDGGRWLDMLSDLAPFKALAHRQFHHELLE